MIRLSNKHLLFGVVSLALLTSSMQFSMVSVAIPDLIEDLDAPLGWVGWVVTMYTLMQAVSMPISGKLSDELGRRVVFVGGLAMFAAASLLCALAPNVWVLIAGRAIQGLAGGSLLPSAYGIVAEAFPDSRAQALGLISSIFPIGSILGPNLGGVIVDSVGWRWTFALNVPLAVLVVVIALFLMSPSVRRETSRIDFVGAGLIAVSVTSLVYALTEIGIQTRDPNVFLVTAGFVVAAFGTVSLLRYEQRCSSPIIDLALLRRREFAFVNTLNFFYGVAVFGVFSFIPLFASSAYGMGSGETGRLLTPRAVVMMVVSSAASVALPRTGYRKPIIGGLLLMAAGMVLLSLEIHEVEVLGLTFSEFTVLAAIVAFAGLGLGLAGPAANNAAIELAPDRVAAITGMRGMFRSLGGAIGVALIVLITSTASSVQHGLAIAFVGLSVLTVLTSLLVLGIPDKSTPLSLLRPPQIPHEARQRNGITSPSEPHPVPPQREEPHELR